MCGPTGRKEPLWLRGYPNAADPERDRAHEPQPGTDLYLRGERDNKGNARCFMVGAHKRTQKAPRDLEVTEYDRILPGCLPADIEQNGDCPETKLKFSHKQKKQTH